MAGSRRGKFALALAAVTLLGGCSTAENLGEDNSEPALPAVITPVDPTTLALPLDPYVVSSRNLAVSTQAETLLLNRCLARFGLTLPPQPAAPIAQAGHPRRYGIVDAEQAATRGYHGPARTAVAAQPPSSISPVVEAVILGSGQQTYAGQQVPEGGCIGEARRKVAEGAPTVGDPDLGTSLAHDSWLRSRQDSRVVRANEQWKACMAKAGFDYADPLKANDDPAFGASEPTASEIAIATVDVACKVESKVVDVWATAEIAYQKRAIERNAEALATIKSNYEVRERNAARIVAGG